MTDLRAIGIELALKRSALRTADAIRNGKCFADIFTIAIQEVGKEVVVDAIVESKNSWLARHALIHVARDATDTARLVGALIAGGDTSAASALIWSFNPSLPMTLAAKISQAMNVGERPYLGDVV